MKFLIIDDNITWCETAERLFKDNPNVRVFMCGSVMDALEAIRYFQPAVVFLDHRLSDNGNEGFEIVDQAVDVRFYSTTTSRDQNIIEAYRIKGVDVIGPNMGKIKEIIEANS